MQIPVALDGTNEDEVFRMCASVNMAMYAIEMTKLELKCNLVALQAGSSELFSENDVITKYEVEQSFDSPFYIVFHYYLQGHRNMVHYTISNASFNTVIKILQTHCICFGFFSNQ